ncbi:hypothetical protein VTN00DRAFT_4591 [Thermoascus crustaceus]|uniref:uncharacterized protein n=1 Tax=Thermoascus crustaceus TaxID=5088 RepID=UPI0037430ABD
MEGASFVQIGPYDNTIGIFHLLKNTRLSYNKATWRYAADMRSNFPCPCVVLRSTETSGSYPLLNHGVHRISISLKTKYKAHIGNIQKQAI